MSISVESSNPWQQDCSLLVVDSKNKNLPKKLQQLLKKEDFKHGVKESKLLYAESLDHADYILIVGLGETKKITAENLRRIGSNVYKAAKQIKAKSVRLLNLVETSKKLKAADCAGALVEGYVLSGYKFERYIKKSKDKATELIVHTSKKSNQAAIKKSCERAQVLCEGVFLSRDMVNTPAADMCPKDFVTIAKGLKGVRTRIHDLAAIKKMKMGAFLSVAQGSTATPPYFIEMHYKPKGKAKKKIAIVGKGVTFDSGGYSLKPPKGMETMKDDMAGASAVLGLMSIVSRLAPKAEVSGYVAATENMVDGYAQRPGDVCRAMNGKTIEVLNTDAEGRLTLADALHYAIQKKPDYVIDMATLTGACLVALGMRCAGIMGNDQKLIDSLIQSGSQTGEALWQLPLFEEYDEQLKSPIADLKNIGSSYGGTITAGLFLQHFVGDAKWAHIDIAGPAWSDGAQSYIHKGGTGFMVRTLADFLARV